MHSAADDLLVARSAVGRPLRFDEYLSVALYGPHGFYTSGGQAGRRGDFITSPEIGPLFGAVLARWIEAEFRRLGAPDDFTITEVGAGPGTLARAILSVAPRWAGRYVAVELSAAQRESHPEGVVSVAEMPEGRRRGVVVANELLDNLPFRLAVFDGGWREAMVEVSADGALLEVTAPAPAHWSWLPSLAPHGARVPVQEDANAWVHRARRSIAHGTVLAIDYCTPRTALLADVPWRDWLRTYRGHERGGHYLRDPGEQDITAQVCVDQLPEVTAARSQAQFLQRWGIEEMIEEGKSVWRAQVASPTVHSLRMRSRVGEGESLLDHSGLGSFVILEWSS